MPRPAPRAHPSRAAEATPSRRLTTSNGIADGIPPVMLQTPPHAPFVTTPLAFNDARASVIPNDQPQQHLHHLRNYHTPTTSSQTEDAPHLQATAMDLHMSDADPVEDDSLLESVPHDPDDTRQLIGLRDISSLATWTLSSSKPGCGLAQLRHPSPSHFWQSDGPQPHTLTLHFFKLVAIVKMRVYLDFDLDESYTPTKMRFFAGMSEGGVVEFATWKVQEGVDPETGETTSGVENVRGWIDISLRGVGGRDTIHHGTDLTPNPKKLGKPSSTSKAELYHRHGLGPDPRTLNDALSSGEEHQDEDDMLSATDGNVLKCMVIQVRICENHQNGKDTHVRGFQVFARDENAGKGNRKIIKKGITRSKADDASHSHAGDAEEEILGLEEADWMGEPELR